MHTRELLSRTIAILESIKKLKYPSLNKLLDEMEDTEGFGRLSRRTLFRDIQYLRDSLNWPIYYDQRKMGYGIEWEKGKKEGFDPKVKDPKSILEYRSKHSLIKLGSPVCRNGLGANPACIPARRCSIAETGALLATVAAGSPTQFPGSPLCRSFPCHCRGDCPAPSGFIGASNRFCRLAANTYGRNCRGAVDQLHHCRRP